MSNYKRITLSQKRLIKSLQIKKYRKQEQCFLVEGAKSIQELMTSDFEIVMIAGTEAFLSRIELKGVEAAVVSEKELEGLGEFQSNNAAIAVARIKPNLPFTVDQDEFALVLDDIRDPGNLGTIIRTADWYGIRKLIASNETADFYSSKVITSTMGSFTRISIYYTNLEPFLKQSNQSIYGTFLDGQSIHNTVFEKGGLIVIGNESLGISSKLDHLITNRITIPKFGEAESLNAAIATAIICDNLRRNL
jgi:TrmH family RNA methyltransferase